MLKDMEANITQSGQVLRDFFGYDSFRAGQREVIEAILRGRDCLGVMPTGAGKSICYQVPALVLAGSRRLGSSGETGGQGATDSPSNSGYNGSYVLGEFVPQRTLTLVVSPLVSLMSDQVIGLSSSGIPAAYLNSQLSAAQQAEVLSRAAAGAYALLYIAPERLSDPRFQSFASAVPIPFVAVDEAHCVSQWGQDFRPSYLEIGKFIASMPERPVVAAFTATATPRVADDIVRLLGLCDPLRVTTGFDRPNLHFAVYQLPEKKKLARIAAHALANPSESGIVYCSTRKAVESVHAALLEAGVKATRYHAGLSSAERSANQRAFVNDDAPIMVATNAFGMGIDKSNVRFVIHHNMPGSLEAYYQEAGRAGRDGEPSECMLLWNDSDIATARFFIEQETGNEVLTPEEQQVVRASQRRRLAAMTGYCMTVECLRAYILRYFGEELSAGGSSVLSGVDSSAGAAAEPNIEPSIEPNIGQSAGMGANSNTHPYAEPGANQNANPNANMGVKPVKTPQSVMLDKKGCGNCSNCGGAIDAIDVTTTARSVMRCVHELRGRYGKGIVADVLCGSQSQKVREFGLVRAKTYNIIDGSTALVKEVIELLTAGEYLEISEGRYPLVGLGPRAREAATDEFRLYMKRVKKVAEATSGKSSSGKTSKGKSRQLAEQHSALETAAQRDLFERLRQLRKRLADEEGVPPYIVFSDAALRSMCALMPKTEEEFLEVNGVGPTKLKRYGKSFLEEISNEPGDHTS